MKANRRLCLSKILVVVAAVCGSASLSSAQSQIRGEFTLPFEARWGQAVLPAGEYSFNLRSIQAPDVIQIRGQGKNVLLMSQGTSDLPTATDSVLVLVQNGATYVVRSLRLAPLGITLHYTPHKGEAQSVAMSNASTRQVPVHVSAR